MSGGTRVELLDNRNEGRSLRAAWHPDRRILVVSHWRGNICVATTPLGVDQVGPLAGLLVGVLAEDAARPPTPGQPPSLSSLRRDAGEVVRRWTRSVLGHRSAAAPTSGPASGPTPGPSDDTVADIVDWPA